MLNDQHSPASGDDIADVPIQPPAEAKDAEAKDEVELKLLIPAGMLDQVREAPVIARNLHDGGAPRRLESVYYDTSDRILYRNGCSLRVRRSGERYVQTLKRQPAHGRPFIRGEWETELEGVGPDPALLPVSEIGGLPEGLTRDALDPIFVTKVNRRTAKLDLHGTVIEAAIDEGCIEAGEQCEPLSEIELELKAGEARVLYDLGIELLEIAPLRIGTQSKADRGYGLAFGLTPRSTKATAPGITAEHTVDEIIGELLGACQHQLLANETVAEAGRDPEGVHQMRVALRRLRTACALLRAALASPTLQALDAEAKWLATSLGTVRDWDVLITETLRGPAAALASDMVDFDALRAAAEPHRAKAYAALRETLASPRYSRFQLSLRHWIESRGWRNELATGSLAVLLQPAPKFAAGVLGRWHRKALKRGAHFRHLHPNARHRLRVALKKLRYAVEFFQAVYGDGGPSKAYLECLEKLQDGLGHANDASVAWPFLCTLAGDRLTAEAQRTIGAVMGWQARDRLEIGWVLRKDWRRFKIIPTFWAN
jgi:inorganic triphosphatase YgiF